MENLEVKIIEGDNHMATYQDPAFVAAIKSFIEKHTSLSISEETHEDVSR